MVALWEGKPRNFQQILSNVEFSYNTLRACDRSHHSLSLSVISSWHPVLSMVDEISKEAEFLFEMVKDRYGNRLSAEELEEVRKGVLGLVKTAEVLRSVKLGNSTEPFSIFKPYKKGGVMDGESSLQPTALVAVPLVMSVKEPSPYSNLQFPMLIR